MGFLSTKYNSPLSAWREEALRRCRPIRRPHRAPSFARAASQQGWAVCSSQLGPLVHVTWAQAGAPTPGPRASCSCTAAACRAVSCFNRAQTDVAGLFPSPPRHPPHCREDSNFPASRRGRASTGGPACRTCLPDSHRIPGVGRRPSWPRSGLRSNSGACWRHVLFNSRIYGPVGSQSSVKRKRFPIEEGRAGSSSGPPKRPGSGGRARPGWSGQAAGAEGLRRIPGCCQRRAG